MVGYLVQLEQRYVCVGPGCSDEDIRRPVRGHRGRTSLHSHSAYSLHLALLFQTNLILKFKKKKQKKTVCKKGNEEETVLLPRSSRSVFENDNLANTGRPVTHMHEWDSRKELAFFERHGSARGQVGWGSGHAGPPAQRPTTLLPLCSPSNYFIFLPHIKLTNLIVIAFLPILFHFLLFQQTPISLTTILSL